MASNKFKSHKARQKIVDLYTTVNNLAIVAEKFRCTPETVRRIVNKAGLLSNHPDKRPKRLQSDEELYQTSLRCLENNQLHEGTLRKHAKRILLYENGHKCMICHTTEWLGKPVPLICDHIDGNSRNNLKENFRLVCANCDAQLPTYKSRNRGRGRTILMEDSAEVANVT